MLQAKLSMLYIYTWSTGIAHQFLQETGISLVPPWTLVLGENH